MKIHLRLLPVFGVVLFLSSVNADAQDKDKKDTKAPNYYPMQAGAQWHFNVQVGDNSFKAVSKIAKIESIDEVPLARLEAYIDGELKATEHLNQTDKGVFRHRNNGKEITPPICLLKYPIKAGAKWEGDITVGTETGKYYCEVQDDDVSVPAGKFKTTRVSIRLESDVKGEKKVVNTKYWFVPNIGFVRQTVDAGDLHIVMELEKFEMGKQPKK